MSVSNITIQWDRVDCLDRNGDVTLYRVKFGLTSSAEREARFTDVNTRMFTIIGFFWPRMSYTFEVEAINIAQLLIGPAASVTVVTPTPKREY